MGSRWPERMASRIAWPLVPVMSLSTWWSCRFIWLSAFCMCRMCSAAISSRLPRCRHRVMKGTDRIRWPEARPQQPDRVQILDPLAVTYVALPSGHTFQIMRIDQIDLEPALLQDLKQRDPVPPRRLHCHRLNPAPAEPIGQCMQVAGEATKPARRFLI